MFPDQYGMDNGQGLLKNRFPPKYHLPSVVESQVIKIYLSVSVSIT